VVPRSHPIINILRCIIRNYGLCWIRRLEWRDPSSITREENILISFVRCDRELSSPAWAGQAGVIELNCLDLRLVKGLEVREGFNKGCNTPTTIQNLLKSLRYQVQLSPSLIHQPVLEHPTQDLIFAVSSKISYNCGCSNSQRKPVSL